MTEFKAGDRVKDKGSYGLGTVLGPNGDNGYEVRFDSFEDYDDSEIMDSHFRTASEIELVESPKLSVFGPLAQEQLAQAIAVNIGVGKEAIDEFVNSASKLAGTDPTSPAHYDFNGVQVIDITRHLSFPLGNVVKYVTRAGRKGDVLEDLLKAQVYLTWAIEDAEKENA